MARPTRKTILGFPGITPEKYVQYREALRQEDAKPDPKAKKSFEDAAQRVMPQWSKYL